MDLLKPVIKDADQVEDHLGIVLAQFEQKLIADIERLLDERQIVTTFRKGVTP